MGRNLKFFSNTHKTASKVGYFQQKCVSWTLSFIWLTLLNCSLGRKFK